jgi:hypothetical protein
MLLDAGAHPNLPWTRWDVGRRLRASGRLRTARLPRRGRGPGWRRRCGAGGRPRRVGATARRAAACQGPPGRRRLRLDPRPVRVAGPNRCGALLDSGMPVDSRGWSNFTPLDQAAMHGRTATVRLLIDRGADLHDCAFDEDGPTPLDCALWGLHNNRADDGDYPARSRHCSRPTHPPGSRHPPVTKPSMRSSPLARPDADGPAVSRPDGKPGLKEDPAVQRPEASLDTAGPRRARPGLRAATPPRRPPVRPAAARRHPGSRQVAPRGR